VGRKNIQGESSSEEIAILSVQMKSKRWTRRRRNVRGLRTLKKYSKSEKIRSSGGGATVVVGSQQRGPIAI
jgi:hypothetical protein